VEWRDCDCEGAATPGWVPTMCLKGSGRGSAVTTWGAARACRLPIDVRPIGDPNRVGFFRTGFASHAATALALAGVVWLVWSGCCRLAAVVWLLSSGEGERGRGEATVQGQQQQYYYYHHHHHTTRQLHPHRLTTSRQRACLV
jgi:hypothetical protein